MARGKAEHDAYKEALSRLGRELTRRARSRCELSGATGSLLTYDLEGPKVEPDLDHVVLVCGEVADHLIGRTKGASLRYLETAVWSAERAVRRAAVGILAGIDEQWARDAIDNAVVMDQSED